MTNPGTDFFLGHYRLPRQQLRPAVTSQKAFHYLELKLCLVLFHETL